MTVGASIGLIEMNEQDMLSIVFTSPSGETMSDYVWRIRFSSTANYTTLTGKRFTTEDGSLIVSADDLTMVISPSRDGLGVPVDLSGTGAKFIDYYFDILQFKLDQTYRETRADGILRVHRVVTKEE